MRRPLSIRFDMYVALLDLYIPAGEEVTRMHVSRRDSGLAAYNGRQGSSQYVVSARRRNARAARTGTPWYAANGKLSVGTESINGPAGSVCRGHRARARLATLLTYALDPRGTWERNYDIVFVLA